MRVPDVDQPSPLPRPNRTKSGAQLNVVPSMASRLNPKILKPPFELVNT
jgi:hypothetical protein